jgi:hypothetical protein
MANRTTPSNDGGDARTLAQSGRLQWQAMRKEMKGYYEVRVMCPCKGEERQVICLGSSNQAEPPSLHKRSNAAQRVGLYRQIELAEGLWLLWGCGSGCSQVQSVANGLSFR